MLDSSKETKAFDCNIATKSRAKSTANYMRKTKIANIAVTATNLSNVQHMGRCVGDVV